MATRARDGVNRRGSWRTRGALWLTGLLAAATALGCSPTQNVRALRAYAFESPSLPVAVSRVEDLDEALALVDRLLFETPYTPGAPWVAALALDDAEATRLRAELRRKAPYNDPDYEIPVVTLYRVHLTRVLDGARSAGRSAKSAPDEELVLEEDDAEDSATEKDSAADEGAEGRRAGSADEPKDDGARRGGARYANVAEALGVLDPSLAALRKDWTHYGEQQAELVAAREALAEAKDRFPPQQLFAPDSARPPELVQAEQRYEQAKAAADRTEQALAARVKALGAPKSDEQRRIAKDALVISSVLTRLELEALALVPIVAVQAVRSLPDAPSQAGAAARSGAMTTATEGAAGVTELTALPARISAIEERLRRQLPILKPLAESLARHGAQDLNDTAGFQLRESAVDQIAGITLDSLRVSVAAGAEAFFYSAIGAEERRDSENVSYDYTGRRQRMTYEVSPILLAYANLKVNLDWVQLPDAVGLNLGFATDRAFRSGGELEQGSLGSELGAEGLASDALNIGLAVLGVQSSVRYASFTAGEAVVRDVATDVELGRAPFKFKMTQIDVGYDIAFLLGADAGKAFLEYLVVGGRYFDYQLPRILYEFEDQDPSDERARYTYQRESPAQLVNSRYYMAGVKGRFGPGETARFAPYFDMALFFGGGGTHYYFLRDDPGPDIDGNRVEESTTALAADLGFAIGARYRVFRDGNRLRLYINGVYSGELIGSQLTAGSGEGDKARVIDFGASDLFHGPQITLSGAF
ncbi:MAG: hypothetical protein KIT72_13025 [Polyangiaceae bacterium]|nr:hypothetical protein [Polyangiaceae bacterium]MCW5791333.1 hypothetical protein [Polyangiaceae bacterium]